MDREHFEELVVEAVEGLPEEFHERLENIVLVVEDWPSREQMISLGLEYRDELLGLYEGVPLTEGGRDHALLPDRITIFRKPIQRMCRTDEEVRRRVAETVRHEIAHYFGISDARMDEIEMEREDRG